MPAGDMVLSRTYIMAATGLLYTREKLARGGEPFIPLAIVFGIAVFNTLIFWWTDEGSPIEWIEPIILGAFVFQPMLFAIWAAFGSGRFATRFAIVVPCLLLVIAASGLRTDSFAQVQRHEFLVTVVAAMISLVLTTTVLVVLRRITRLQIQHEYDNLTADTRRFQFGTRYLLLLITFYAAALGITSSLTFGPAEANQLFGPDFYARVAAIAGATISFVISPIIAVTLLVLYSRPKEWAVRSVATGWLILTFLVTSALLAFDNDEEMLLAPLLLQLGAAFIGIPAAISLRLSGYQLRVISSRL
jgi:hypothetical protein